MELSKILSVDVSDQPQNEGDQSFIGGKPCLPDSVAIPVCELCGAKQTFFFQVAFPEDHVWHDYSMAVFACTSCAHEEYLIPEMLDGPLSGADIPEGFLENQRNFRILVFETKTGTTRNDYNEKVQFKRWHLISTSESDANENKVGGRPNWLLDDESPATYNGLVPMFFLIQLLEDFKFDILSDAPPQTRIGLRGKPEPSKNFYYELFLSNNLYFFGTKDRSEPLVYILTQV